MTERFILIEDNPEFPITERTCWYWDTKRPIKHPQLSQLEYREDNAAYIDGAQPFVAVQCYRNKNPNKDVVYHENMALLFNDQAEYYAVCQNCRCVYGNMQWSGNTRNYGWREKSAAYLRKHQELKGWCEFCDPVFGNGGWRLD